MADFADVGSDYTERWLEAQIQEHQYQLNQAGNIEEEPECRNCREPLPPGQHYCSRECANDFAYRIAAERRNGKYRGD